MFFVIYMASAINNKILSAHTAFFLAVGIASIWLRWQERLSKP